MRCIDTIMEILLYFLLVICNINKFSYGNFDKNALPPTSASSTLNSMTLLPNTNNDVQQEHIKNSFEQSSNNKDDDHDLNILRRKRNDIGFVRLGKNNLKNSFLRFGKSSKNQNFVRLGRRNDKDTNDQSFIRFGRNDKNFVRFGRNNNNNDDTNDIAYQNNEPSMKFGRRGDKFIRFGRKDKLMNITTAAYDSSIEHNDIGAVTTDAVDDDDINLIPIKWNKNTNKFIRLGRSPGFIRLGKKLMLLNKKNEEYEKNLTPGIGKRTNNVLLSPLYNKHKIIIMEHDDDDNNDNAHANVNDFDSNFVSTNTEDKLIVPLPLQIYLNEHKIFKTIPSDADNEIDYEQDSKFNSNYLENEYLNENNQP